MENLNQEDFSKWLGCKPPKKLGKIEPMRLLQNNKIKLEDFIKGLKNILTMQVKVVNDSNNPLPEYSTKGSAGMDLRAWLDGSTTLEPMERRLIPTGLHISLPEGYEAMIRPRSGLALKHGITCLNTPGCIDSDYRGDIGVILINLGSEPFEINPGDRIAQMTITNYEQINWMPVETLDETERGEGGFGSTGK